MKGVSMTLTYLTLTAFGIPREVTVYAVILIEMFLTWGYYELTGRRDFSLASPLLAGYLATYPENWPWVIASFVISLLVIELFYWRFLFYGMRSLYLAMTVSSLIILILLGASITSLLMSTLPGLLAYDVHTSMDRKRTLIASWGLILITSFMMSW